MNIYILQKLKIVKLLDAPESLREITDRIVVNASDTVDIACSFDGNPTPQVKWTKSENSQILGTGMTLAFDQVKQEDSGIYQCMAESPLGVAYNNINLVVRGPPIITSVTGTMLTIGKFATNILVDILL